ncbi:MAG TPA: extracellular solute-binding protein [Anaerolineae bacterium]|jgi:alpha-glucoside transport system substrate-binding protein|nr:extracellular solute-binding protein [Anaerolineae bacterium]
MSESSINPYLGPRTFEERHAHLFFGREPEARDLLASVVSEPLLFFYAPSGAGKSSLINTRLIPGLRNEGFHVLRGRIGGAPSDDQVAADNVYVHNLLASINQGQVADPELPYTSIGAFVRQTRSAIDDAELPIVLIVDQFEELITRYQAYWHQRETFFHQLSQALDDDPLLWVVLSFREDFLATIEPYARSLPGHLLTRFQMQRMRYPAALEAVKRPATDHGRPFAEGVASDLVNNLRQIRALEVEDTRMGEFVEPVQLQVVCYQLWENLRDKPLAQITAQDVAELGDVDQALGEFYQRTIHDALTITDLSELELRSWFDRKLITEDQTRGTVYQGPEETAGLENEVVRHLADHYLLRSEIRAGGAWYELVHDRLVSPILRTNSAWRDAQGPALRAAELWQASNRSPDRLYEGAQLKEAVANLDQRTAEPLVREFLAAGEAAQRQREEEQARQLKEAQAEAERQKRRADEQARTSRRLRLLAAGLLVVFLAAVALGIFAVIQAREADQQTEKVGELTQALATQVQANSRLATASASDDSEAAATAQAEADAAATSVAAAQANVGADAIGSYLDRAFGGEFRDESVTVMGRWGDAQAVALEAALEPFVAATGINVSIDHPPDFKQRIEQRAKTGDPPDVAAFANPKLMADFARRGLLADLRDIMDDAVLNDRYGPALIDLAQVDGTLVGLPYQFFLKSLVFYSPQKWAAFGYTPPENWDQLIDLMDDMVANGLTPWCIAMENGDATGWVATDWVEEIVLRTAAPEVYDSWIRHEMKFSDPLIRAAVEKMGEIWLNPAYVLDGTDGILTTNFGEVGALFEEPPNGCMMHRQGSFLMEFVPEDVNRDTDVATFYFPPIDPAHGRPVLGSADLISAFNMDPAVRAMMEYLASPEAAEVWIKEFGGFVSPNSHVPLDWYPNDLDRRQAEILRSATATRYDASDLMPGEVGSGSFWAGMVDYISGADLDQVLNDIDASWPADAN